MKSSLWLVLSEFKQNRFHFILIFCVSLLLGLSGNLSLRAEHKVAMLANADKWNADVVVLPKGVTLQDFKEEILSGSASAFLPEAMFDSTASMAQGQFQLEAILPLKDDVGPIVMAKGDDSELGTQSFKNLIRMVSWHDQTTYSTPEWKNKLIAGFFAKGSPLVMKNLKDLIDKRTVGQAIMIEQQQKRDEKIQSQLQEALFVYSGTLLVLVALSFLSLMLWLKIRISNSLKVFQELGMTSSGRSQYLIGLLVISVLIPSLIGMEIASSLISF